MQCRKKLIAKGFQNRDGSIAVVFALCLAVIIGAAALAVDVGYWFLQKEQMQEAVDKATLSAVHELNSDPTNKRQIESVVTAYLATTSGGQNGAASIALDASANILKVKLTKPGPRFLSKLFLGSDPSIVVTASAQIAAGGSTASSMPVCVLALDSAMRGQITVSGGGTWTANNCIVWQNSSANSAVSYTAGASLSSARNCFNGGHSGRSFTPEPLNCGVKTDPFADMSWSTPKTCDYNNFSHGAGAVTLDPGVYCGGISLSGGPTVTLNPGTYVIRDGSLAMNGGGSMTGTGITFVIEGSATVNLSGGGNYHLVAPATGQFASFIFFQDPASSGTTANVTGRGKLYYEGIIYFPNQAVTLSGGGLTSTPSPFTVFIGKSFSYSGGSNLSINIDNTATSVPIPNAIYEKTAKPARLID